MPAASSAAMSSDGMPLTRSMVSTPSARQRPVHFRHVQVGRVQPQAAHQAGVGALALQVELGVQRALDLADPLPAAGSSSAFGWWRSASDASVRSRLMSASICSRMPGRSTFTTTSRPSCSVAGVHLRDRGRGERGFVEAGVQLRRPACRARPRSPCARRAPGNGATWSRSRLSSSAISGGSRSRRVDSTWPNLTKIGPSSCSARRRRLPRGKSASALTAGVNGRSSHSHLPKAVDSSSASSRCLQQHAGDAQRPECRPHAPRPCASSSTRRAGARRAPARARRDRAARRRRRGRPTVRRGRPRRAIPR